MNELVLLHNYININVNPKEMEQFCNRFAIMKASIVVKSHKNF
jgi:hypothetical protein